MKILIAWDKEEESNLLDLYLNTGENQATVALRLPDVQVHLDQGHWDAVLMSLTFPTPDDGLTLFGMVQQSLPGVPILLACRSTEMINLPRFLNRGLRFYIIRDEGGDFVFLVLASLESAVAAVKAEEARKLAERLREEMDGVRRLQESIIPKGLKPPAGYYTAARYEPSQVNVLGDRPVVMAGGDYYDLFRADDHTLIALIGDASGHGLKACMSIMAMHTLIRMFPGDHYRQTAAFVGEINERLCENSIVQSDGGFITLFYASLDTATHTLTWTSAGHPAALLHNMRTNEVTQVGKDSDGGLPLGIASGITYEAFSLGVPPESRVLIYSDGLSDALPLETTGQTSFGIQGIKESLQRCREENIEKTLDELFQASNRFTGGMGRHDDTSVMLLERHA